MQRSGSGEDRMLVTSAIIIKRKTGAQRIKPIYMHNNRYIILIQIIIITIIKSAAAVIFKV